MNNRLVLGLAVGAGYVLGRTKKAKLAFAVGTLVAGKRLQLSPKAIGEFVTQQLQNNPQFKELGDQLRQDLGGVGKAATGALVNRQLEGFADRLHGRTLGVQDRLQGVVPGSRDEDEGHAEDTEDAEARDSADGEDGGDEEEHRERREPQKKAAPQKKTAARRTTAKKTAAPARRATKKTASKTTAAKRAASKGGRDRG
ncbi:MULTISPECIES: DNA primase [unclassified Streptomyces]|uniref:DNA primase n=1 Tax=unclassified Streptomyces TaxID=2593676 RepID=UPI0028C418D7|nr:MULTISPECIES: DNA primase [unclassified Streptomyces]WNO76168.1 DNA primase [Streptomyces sp. AM8-1-1]